MQKNLISIIALSLILFTGCQKMEQNKLNRQMKKMAKAYLEKEEVKDYKDLTITCVDTITEFSYAKLTSELLGNMEVMYEQMYWDESEDSSKREVIGLYLNEIRRTKADFEDLMDNGDLQTEGILLYMVTGSFQLDGQKQDMMFLVNPDKKSLHELDPFSDNLLYKDE
jgi:NACalpha-BTF3-like transcription factor